MEDNKTVTVKYAGLKVFCIITLSLIIMVAAQLTAQYLGVMNLTVVSVELMLTGSLSYLINITVMLFIISRSIFSFGEIGFRQPLNTNRRLYTALIAVHVLYLFVLWLGAGVKAEATFLFIMTSLLYSILVGIGEELVFRGLVYRYLLKFGIAKAIVLSSVLFGAGHLINAATGANDFIPALLQAVNAFLFGWAAVSLRIYTKSLWPVIIWHFLFDVLSLIFNFDFASLSIGGWLFIIIMAVFNTAFALWLTKQIKLNMKNEYT